MNDQFADDIAAIARLDVVPKILDVVCRTTGMGFAAVARVTEDRWIACAVRDDIAFGLKPGGELEIATTICDEIRDSGEAVVIDCVAQDPVFRDHHTPAQYGFQSYISTPIRYRGEFFGTLCAIDPNPAELKSNDALATFELFAELIGSHLDAQERLARSEAALLSERETAELREQFIAVLGHDLRNPLAAIDGGARLLSKSSLDERATAVVGQVLGSVGRMAGLIDNILDFARGRLGGGLDLDRQADPALAGALDHVISEFRSAQPGRAIVADILLTEPVACDSRRLAQLLSNLIANALTHGDPEAPVSVSGRTVDGRLLLSVANAGAPIHAEVLPKLFQPFARGAGRGSAQGLGLGLYIASEIARAHGGRLEATSDAAETRFTFAMPLET